MRDPYIVLAPDGWFCLTCTHRSQIEGGKQGLTLAPLDVRVVDGDVQIRAKDANYAKPSREEVQDF